MNIELCRMSDTKVDLRWFRVYSADRKNRYAVGASNLKEFIGEAKKKLQIKPSAKVTVVLEEDGTIVDDEAYFQEGVAQNDVLMILQSGEIWTDMHETLACDVTDGAEESENDVVDLRLRELVSLLRTDLKQLLLFSPSDCQIIVDARCDQLSRLLHLSRLDVEAIQSSCQRHIDEHEDFMEACNVLKLAKDTLLSGGSNASQSTDDVDGSKRKRRRAK